MPIFSGLYPVFSWEYDEDVESTTQAGFNIRIGSTQTGWGTSSFAGDKLNILSDSSVPYFEYPYNNLVRGNTYYGQIRVWDPEKDDGGPHITTWEKFHFNINNLPLITSASISPSSPTALDNIRVFYDYSDADNHEDSGSVIRWYKHNILQEEFNDLVEIESKYLAEGDSWTVRVTPFDGLEYGATVTSQAVTVQAANLNIQDIKILPTDANIDDYLKVDYDISEDPYIDLTNSEVEYEWYINGTQSTKTSQIVRLDLSENDVVYAKVIVKNNGNKIAEGQSDAITIADSEWYLSEMKVGGLTEPIGLTELRPAVEWRRHKSKTTEENLPTYFRVLVTRTPSRVSPIFDSGYISYTKDSYLFETDAFQRGRRYFVHIGAGDATSFTNYIYKEVVTAGSSWSENADNNVGWTIEFKAKLGSDAVGSRQGIHIHDGTYFGSMFFAIENVLESGIQKKASRVIFSSGRTETYDIVEPESDQSFHNFQTYRITGVGQNVKIYLNNTLVMTLTGILTVPSNMRELDFGDINMNKSVPGTWKFLRYSTAGNYEIGESDLTDSDEYEFYNVAQIPGGTIECMMDGAVPVVPDKREYFPSSFLVSYTPTGGAGRLLAFNENGTDVTLPVATKNYSPITVIKFDKDQNKYVGSAEGITALYGSKHDPDYSLDTDGIFTISPSDFDLIANLPASIVARALTTNGSIAIDTTYKKLGAETSPEWNGVDPFDPYKISRGILYFSQRTQGHSWFDNVDNDKGWQTEFTLTVGLVEQDEADSTNLDKQGVGIYVNDGTYQEIIIFTQAKVTFLYANVSADINTLYRRTYRIVGKGKNLKLYQRYSIMSPGTEQLLIDGTGLFTTEAVKTANSTRPKIVVDGEGNQHAVWHDDGSRTTTILYSKYTGTWSNPEVVIESSPFTLKNPDIAVDNYGNLYVVYEDLSYGHTEISCSIKDTVGWNPKIRLTNNVGYKSKPRVTVDGNSNVHVVWEDHRNGKAEIFWCYRSKQYEAWQSSGQFAKDENIVSQDSNDADQIDKGVSFKNPTICYTYPNVLVAFEADFGNGDSAIYVSYYDTITQQWTSSGYSGSSVRVSSVSRRAVYPDIAALGNQAVVVWEDQTEPVSQIWGSSLFSDNLAELTPATKVTNRTYNCRNPSVGFVNSLLKAVIVFESRDVVPESGSQSPTSVAAFTDGTEIDDDVYQIFMDFYWSVGQFIGSGTGYTDELILIGSEKKAHHPAVAKMMTSAVFKVLYDYTLSLGSSTDLENEEHPLFSVIGDADVFVESSFVESSADTRAFGTVSSPYTKEFAFGDIDDTVGAQMDFRDISMYFGYDAKPLVTLRISTESVPEWPDNRIYDLYVDGYKNVLAATHRGLAYYNVIDRSVQMLKINPDAADETDYIVTALDYAKNGVWFVGTTGFLVYSYDGGQTWHKVADITGVHSISCDNYGSGVVATDSGIYVVPMDFTNIDQGGDIHKTPIHITLTSTGLTSSSVKVVRVDSENIIWAGTENGVVRIENYSNKMLCDTRNGMRSSYVTDICIFDRATRYVATVTGLEKMRGFGFEHVDVLDLGAVSENLLSLNFLSATNSLWFSSENRLYELTFRDPKHEKTPNEVVEYDTEIGMDQSRDKTTHYILGLDTLPDDSYTINDQSITVFINDNPIDYGYSVDTNLDAIVFSDPPLDSDRVSVEINNQISLFKDFAQTSIEQQIYGDQNTNIIKLVKTAQDQLLALSDTDVHSVMAYIGLSNLPFSLLTIDREKPVACLEPVEQLSRTTYKFKVLASDQISGVTDMVVSNYENFTTNGETAQSFEPLAEYVIHDIGDTINQTSTEYSFPSSVTINATDYSVGTGKRLGTLTPTGQTHPFVFAFTTKPVILFRLDVTTEEWTAVAALNNGDVNEEVHSILTVDNTMFVTTGNVSGTGKIYKTINGRDFHLVGSGGNHIYCSVASDSGYVYFGDDQGRIYEYSMNSLGGFAIKSSGIGSKVLGLEYGGNVLYAATENTGKNGCGLSIDLTNSNVLTFFPQSYGKLTDIQIINEDLFVVADDRHEIWRSEYRAGEELDFVKSYSTFASTIIRLYSVPSEVLVDVIETEAPAAPA